MSLPSTHSIQDVMEMVAEATIVLVFIPWAETYIEVSRTKAVQLLSAAQQHGTQEILACSKTVGNDGRLWKQLKIG